MIHEYLWSMRDTGFKWGENDCVHFVYNGLKSQGHDVIDLSSVGEYDDEKTARKEFRKVLASYKCTSMPQLLDKLLQRCYHIPDSGSVVAKIDPVDSSTGYLLGLVSGYHGVFMGPSGLVRERLDRKNFLYWTVK